MKRPSLDTVLLVILIVIVCLGIFSPRFNWVIRYHGPTPRAVAPK